MRVCARACVCACVRACVRVCIAGNKNCPLCRASFTSVLPVPSLEANPKAWFKVCVCVCVSMSVSVSVCVYEDTPTHSLEANAAAWFKVFVCGWVGVYSCVCVCVCVQILHTHTHTHTHTARPSTKPRAYAPTMISSGLIIGLVLVLVLRGVWGGVDKVTVGGLEERHGCKGVVSRSGCASVKKAFKKIIK